MSKGSALIRNGTLITMNAHRQILEGNVYIEDERILEIDSPRTKADTIIDATDCLVTPGFVQSHVHLCQALFRGMADDMDVIDWLRLRIWPLEQAHDEQARGRHDREQAVLREGVGDHEREPDQARDQAHLELVRPEGGGDLLLGGDLELERTATRCDHHS